MTKLPISPFITDAESRFSPDLDAIEHSMNEILPTLEGYILDRTHDDVPPVFLRNPSAEYIELIEFKKAG